MSNQTCDNTSATQDFVVAGMTEEQRDVVLDLDDRLTQALNRIDRLEREIEHLEGCLQQD